MSTSNLSFICKHIACHHHVVNSCFFLQHNAFMQKFFWHNGQAQSIFTLRLTIFFKKYFRPFFFSRSIDQIYKNNEQK